MYYLLGHTSLLQSLCPSSDPMHSWPPFWALSNLVLCLDCWPPPHITEQPLQEFQSLHWQSTKHRINTLWYEKLKMIELVYFYWDRIWFSMCNKSRYWILFIANAKFTLNAEVWSGLGGCLVNLKFFFMFSEIVHLSAEIVHLIRKWHLGKSWAF